MHKTLYALLTLALLIGVSSAADIDRSGTFTWQRKTATSGGLKGTFTPTGKDTYSVVFNCKWKKKPLVYTGTVKGDIMNGKFTGLCTDAAGKRSWNIRGEVKDGVMNCEHYEIKPVKGQAETQEKYTGTFEIQ
jgi:hypothetical protein